MSPSRRHAVRLLPILLALVVCYGGGYYFARHPESLRELSASQSFVVATTLAGQFPPELQGWIENRWGHSIQILVVTENDLAEASERADAVIAPASRVRSLIQSRAAAGKPLPVYTSSASKRLIATDLMMHTESGVPLVWQLTTPDEQGKAIFTRWIFQPTGRLAPDSAVLESLTETFLDPRLQSDWAETLPVEPVLDSLPRTREGLSRLRAVELSKITVN